MNPLCEYLSLPVPIAMALAIIFTVVLISSLPAQG